MLKRCALRWQWARRRCKWVRPIYSVLNALPLKFTAQYCKVRLRNIRALTNLFSGRPARGIVNRFMAELGPINSAVPDFPLASNAIAGLRSAAEQQGFGDFSPLWCGQNATGCQAIPAAELTKQLALGIWLSAEVS